MMEAPWHPASEPPKEPGKYLLWFKDAALEADYQEFYMVGEFDTDTWLVPGRCFWQANWGAVLKGMERDGSHPNEIAYMRETYERYQVLAWAKLPDKPGTGK